MLSLPELQSRFFASIARQPGAGPTSFDPTLVSYVEGRGQLGAEARVDIYAQMYYARLVDVLEGDFPRVSTLLGCERFHAVTSAYLARHPSTSPSLRQLGRLFASFLQTYPDTRDLPFLSDVAALEWSRVDVFDAPDTELLRIDHLQHIAPDEWPTLKLQVIPALQIIQSEWPVHEIWKAAEQESALPERLHPEPTTLRVWRRDFLVYHTAMDAIEYTALKSVLAGEPFAAVCEALASQLPEEEAASAAGSLLLRWIEDGMLVRLPEK
jgi:hypothetical protein